MIGGAVAVAGVAALGSSRALARNRVEEPTYKLIETVETNDFSYEIRAYAPLIVAETVVKAESARAASNAGFRVLANYIFGGNKGRAEIAMTAPVGIVESRGEGQKIAMTSPVTQQASRDEQGETTWTITFTMPSEWTMETLPVPNDARVRLRELPARRFAVWRFRGAPAHSKVRERMDEFVAELQRAGRSPSDADPVYARYDPPWTPSFMRRNEIMVELRA